MSARKSNLLSLVVVLALLVPGGVPATSAQPQSAFSHALPPVRDDQLQGVMPAAPIYSLELVGQIGGATNAVAVQGDYAYVGVGPRLVTLNISNPANPVVVGQTGVLPDVVQGVVVTGTYAYVAAGDSGLRIINVSDPAAPANAGSYDTPGFAEGVAVAGNHAVESRKDVP